MTFSHEHIENHTGNSILTEYEKCLISRFKNGESKAFEEIYETYSDLVFKYGQSITSDLPLLEDALQDLFVLIWNKRNEIEFHYSISFYLIKSFRRIAIRKVKEARGKQVQLNDYFQSHEGLHETFAEDELPNVESIKTAIKSLPAKQYEVIMLKYFCGYSSVRIANIMGITVESTYNLVARALTKLRKNI